MAKHLVNIDLTGNEIQNVVVHNSATAPTASAKAGGLYFDTNGGANKLRYHNGTSWVEVTIGGSGTWQPYDADLNAIASLTGTAGFLVTTGSGSWYVDTADYQPLDQDLTDIAALTGDGLLRRASSTWVMDTTSYGITTDGLDQFASTTSAELAGVISDETGYNTGAVVVFNDNPTIKGGLTGASSSATIDLFNTVDTTTLNLATFADTINIGASGGIVEFQGDVELNGRTITGLADPLNNSDAANKGYVDNAISGLAWKDSVHLLSDVDVALTGLTETLVIDGHAALDSGDNGYRILLINETDPSKNGIYTYSDDGTDYTLTRSTDADTFEELIGAAVFVKEGTDYGQTAWVQAEHYLSDFEDQVWVQFSGQGTYLAEDGVQLTGNVFSFAPKIDGGLGASASGAFIQLQTNSGLATTVNGLAVGAGTGISVVDGNVGIDTSVVPRKYTTAIGNGSATSITVTHNLNNRDVIVQVRRTASPYDVVYADVELTSTSTTTINFADAPESNEYTVTVIG
jgi:hypothetical protein